MLVMIEDWDFFFEINQVMNPCVYEFLRDEESLYVGCSRHGLARVFNFKAGNGKGMTLPTMRYRRSDYMRSQAVKESNRVQVKFFSSFREAEMNESSLIWSHQPKYNSEWKSAKPSDYGRLGGYKFGQRIKRERRK
jgi:hypothetical protein